MSSSQDLDTLKPANAGMAQAGIGQRMDTSDEGAFEAVPPNASNETKIAHGFQMQIQRKHRKRKRDDAALAGSTGGANMSLSSSSSSSSDEDDDTKRDAASNDPSLQLEHHKHKLQQGNDIGYQGDTPLEKGNADGSIKHLGESMGRNSKVQDKGLHQHGQHNSPDLHRNQNQNQSQNQHQNQNQQQQNQQQHSQNQQQQQNQQPDGWRVKLYRLNADGSWDDCGTGRILCLYKQQPKSNDGSQTNPSASNLTGDGWIYQELGEPTLCMHSEVNNSSGTPTPRILLRTRILLRDAYQRQGDNIITWCEPYLEEGNPAQGVDLALSFQDNAGCLDIWRQITQVQSKAADLYRRSGGDRAGQNVMNGMNGNNNSQFTKYNGNENQGPDGRNNNGGSGQNRNDSNDVSNPITPSHHADLQRQDQQEMWVNVASDATQRHLDHHSSIVVRNHDNHFEDAVGGMVASYHDSGGANQSQNTPQSPQLPNPPALSNLEEIADTIAAVQHIQQRESLAMYISQNECSYLKSLLSLFPSAESRGDYGSLATLAACVKTILLLNDPSIIELIVSDELIFEEVCSTLEYDPDLRDKANHRWFLRERAKFRTVALMEDEELIAAIHRSFRVNYLRDTLLRPTMDESSLSTLSSLQTFTHADVVKGVTMSPAGTDDKGELLKDSYLAKVIRILGRELHAICEMEWDELEALPPSSDIQSILLKRQHESPLDPSTIVATGKYPQSQKMSTTWKQHLAPQDNSLASRRVRRRGSLSFLRELFNMVRISLQQSDKDDFFAVLVSMEVDLGYNDMKSFRPNSSTNSMTNTQSRSDMKIERNKPDTSVSPDDALQSMKPVNLLSLLGTALADPNTDVTEKGSVLEIIAGIAMHDPSLIRRRCLDFCMSWKKERKSEGYNDRIGPIRPSPNEKNQIIFHCPPNDLLGSLLFLLAVETDAGVLLQVSEIMRIILDTDMMGDHGPMGAGFADEAEGIPPGGGHNPPHEQHCSQSGSISSTTDQNQFLSMFYDHYVQWLSAPFLYTILHPVRRVPDSNINGHSNSALTNSVIQRFEKGDGEDDPMLRLVPMCAIRSSFAVELLSFCVRAHLYRMKCYLLRSKVLGCVLKLLKPSTLARNTSGDRCLKLAALRFLRAILSVNDEFYHRHIIQHNLFAPVFEAFRANPVGDNLVSSAIVEMCDFIHSENIKSLIEYIVTKHLSATSADGLVPSLEDVSSPYVSTLTVLRKAYEKNLKGASKLPVSDSQPTESGNSDSRFFQGDASVRSNRTVLSGKALEDQRKFRQVDQEESYFEADDDEPNTVVPLAVDEVAAQEADSDLHRTPRMFSLAQTPLLSPTPLHIDGGRPSGDVSESKDGERSKTAIE